MSELKSSVFTVTDSTIEKHRGGNAKALMALGGTLYAYYGDYSGTPAELQADGIPIPDGKYLEHVETHTGIISLISASGDIKVHEVV